MAFPAPLLRLSWGGSVAGEDIWTNGVHIISTNPDLPAADAFEELTAQQFASIISTTYANAGGMTTFNRLEWVKLALIGTDGKYITDPKIYDYPNPISGTTSFSVSPQDSVVVSFTTDARRGLAHRGRIYPPAGFAAPQSGTGRIQSTQVAAIANRFKTFINGINDILNNLSEISMVVAVAS